ncbi:MULTISPECIES: hypothetical protein [Aphanizomenon]|nr:MULTISPECIES: hypothetical protein [Aphanizomenon]MBD2392210.1 hypothetical protein [Aphanizomenon flos-aquae FACHB-1171]MBD2558814.1 hypothetical protein [Aphanizomenon flos-aquae FACHB-1290]
MPPFSDNLVLKNSQKDVAVAQLGDKTQPQATVINSQISYNAQTTHIQ